MPRVLHRILFLFILASVYSCPLRAQLSGSSDPGKDSLSDFIQMKYGLDQELFNGYQYYTRYIKYQGDPFYPEDGFMEGSVFIRGTGYDHLSLKYNCFSQLLVLEYTDFQGRYNQLILNTAHIDSFRLENGSFQKYSLSDGEPLFYQVLGTPEACVYIHWKKMIKATSDDLQYTHAYSRPLGTFYVSFRGQIHPFTHRNSFLSVFPESMAAEIRKYMRKKRYSFRDASPGDWQSLLNHICLLEISFPEH